MSQDVKPLPRGLVNREGTPVQTSQRLPSFRRDAMSAPTAVQTRLITAGLIGNSVGGGGSGTMINGPTSNTTRGGVTKRVFKPSIPTRRTLAPDATPTTSRDSTRRGRGDSKSPRGGRNNGNAKKERPGKKDFVQLDAAIFNGVAGPTVSKSHSALDVARGGRETVRKTERPSVEKRVTTIKSEKRSREDEKKLLDSLYRDDFIDDSEPESDTDEDMEMSRKPKGWENVNSNTKQAKRDSAANEKNFNTTLSSGIPLNKWLDDGSDSNSKLILFQMPDMLLNRPQGIVGKLKVYKSGRVELIDSESGITFDVVRANNSENSNAVHVKSEGEGRLKHLAKRPPATRQELVSLSKDCVTSLGEIDNSDILIPLPRIPYMPNS